jgi:hypothetical protein
MLFMIELCGIATSDNRNSQPVIIPGDKTNLCLAIALPKHSLEIELRTLLKYFRFWNLIPMLITATVYND